MQRFCLIWNAPRETRGIRSGRGVTGYSTLNSSNKRRFTARLLEVQLPEERDYLRKRPGANTAILVCWMIIMIALLFMVEVHLQKSSIHTSELSSPLASERELQILKDSEVRTVGKHAVAGVVADMNDTMGCAIEKLLRPAPVAAGIRTKLGY